MTPKAVARRILSTWLAGALCGSIAVVGAADITLPQSDGGSLVLAGPAKRVIILAPNITEIFFAAGAGDTVVATVEFSDYPAAAAALPRIGDAFRFDLEQILSHEPDLVVGWQSGNPEAALLKLENLGLSVWRTEIREPDGIPGLVRQTGHATGRSRTAEVIASRLDQRLTDLRTANRNKSILRYFYQVAERPLYTVNGAHLISQGLAICGAVNVFDALPTLAPQIAPEAVLIENPGVLIAPSLPGQPNPLQHWRAWPRLDAVQHERYLLLPADQISRATPRLLDSIELACNLLDEFRAEHP